jgi:hypothetical protein
MGNTGEAAKDRCQIVADGVFKRRQLSTTERIAATFGPPVVLRKQAALAKWP